MVSKNLFAIIIGLVLALVGPVWAQAYESISDFDSFITVNEDGSFSVVETITYNFRDDERHGIFRTLPLTHPQDASVWYKDRVIDIELEQVTRDGTDEPYVIFEDKRNFEARIGDPNTTISGKHVYELTYTVTGGLSYYDDQNPELYWDVTGTDWSVVIDRATARVSTRGDRLAAERACYRGFEGGTGSCDTPSSTSEAIVFRTEKLYPGEGLTIAQSLRSGAVERNIIEVVPKYYIWVPVGALILIAVFNALYLIKTRHRFEHPLVAEYEPYPEALPMYTGVLLDGRLDPKDITAGLLYLAQQGFIKIKKTERKVMFLFEVPDYQITLLRSINEAPTHFHEEILYLLFDGQDKGALVTLSELKSNQSKQRANAKRLQALRSAVADDVVEKGFYEHVIKVQYVITAVTGFILVILGWRFVSNIIGLTLNGVLVFAVFAVLVICMIGIAIIYRRRTRKGYVALNHIKGFKEFLSVTGEERFKFHNSPQSNPEQFLEYLPYAVALGVEKEWSEVFKDVTVPQPGWYDGGSAGSFSAVALASDLGSFSGSFASSSGSSGSSGGGSVGGGAGGGGGGSW